MDHDLIKLSKFISRVLRHRPQAIHLTMDAQGWVSVKELLQNANRQGIPLTQENLQQIVEQNDKRRYALSEDGMRIRASQGHTISVDLGLTSQTSPAKLFHGTAQQFLDSIRQKGLIPGKRNHVHLSKDVETALNVGRRHGQAVVLTVKAEEMAQAGYAFYLSENGVWLTEVVPVMYLVFP